ncbi:hypothetical protein KSX_28700 [Ktedonospora formicarum]|uniref:Uncharacterized protein n=1 Tax=Ktedonospora formicarum TaxID=2778364 RepID=A0A8J3I1V3_9CHLR|nr:hypothetical protein KSX_28700 [Ktedonospora formicarum]
MLSSIIEGLEFAMLTYLGLKRNSMVVYEESNFRLSFYVEELALLCLPDLQNSILGY